MVGGGYRGVPPESRDTLNKQACSSVSTQHSTPYSALVDLPWQIYCMRSNYLWTKLSRMEAFTIFMVFILADVQVPNIIFIYNIDYICNIILV